MPRPDLHAVLLKSALKHLRRGSRAVIALSGGVDSVAMLDAMCSLRAESILDIVAIHVNHGLSPNAATWEFHCAALCRERNVPFESVAVELLPRVRQSPEAVARDARYGALTHAAHRRGIRVVALAHHLDDQAETVLLQLLRGGGARGIAAMPEWRADRRDVDFWRPLLTVPRSVIVEYAIARKLAWIEDESNNDSRFKRNHLRHDVLPIVEQAFAGYRAALSRAARRAQEHVELIDDLADLDAKSCVIGDTLSLASLRQLSPLRAQNVLQRWLSGRGIPVPDFDRLAEFIRQAITARRDRQPLLRLDAMHRLSSASGRIEVLPEQLDAPFSARWRNELCIELPHGTLRFTSTVGSGIDAAKVPEGGLLIRPRKGGERFRPRAGRPMRTLKNVLQEAGIAAPLRRDWPLIVDESSVVAVPGIGVGVDWQCPPGGPGWAVTWEYSR